MRLQELWSETCGSDWHVITHPGAQSASHCRLGSHGQRDSEASEKSRPRISVYSRFICIPMHINALSKEKIAPCDYSLHQYKSQAGLDHTHTRMECIITMPGILLNFAKGWVEATLKETTVSPLSIKHSW